MNMPDIEQQREELIARCESEVMCPCCLRALQPSLSVMVQQFSGNDRVSCAVSCWECYDNFVTPCIAKHGALDEQHCMQIGNGLLLVSDGRELWASAPR